MQPAHDVELEFRRNWPRLLESILEEPKFRDINSGITWLDCVLKNNVLQGKQHRGVALLYAYQSFVPDRSPEDDFLASVLGWSNEIMQGCAIIADDLMDSSEIRRGSPCWYKITGLSAVNDAFLLENIVYFIIAKYFSQKNYYFELLHLIQDIALKTILGQSLDTRLSLSCNLNEYTNENYDTIVKYKTSYYSFYSPLAGAMIMAGLNSTSQLEAAENVVLKIGHLFQVQDDYLDCFGDPSLTGKIGTDIFEGKCTWLIVEALKRGTDEQQKVLKNSYGKTQDVEEIKRIYKELKLRSAFRTYEDDAYNEILDMVENLPAEIPRDPFLMFVNLIYKRSK